MPHISYVNGQYLPHAQAGVHIEDRGYQFGDGIYEVVELADGRFIDWDLHIKRLKRSLAEIRISPPVEWSSLPVIAAELLRRNRRRDGIIYIQVTRGVAPRNHPFPQKAKPALVMTTAGVKLPKAEEFEKGIKVITHPDLRWDRRDIKTINLLPNVLAKQAAVEAGVKEAWLVGEDGVVAEGASTNAYIVTEKGEIITHPADERILGGVTRNTTLRLARAAQIKVSERPFTLAEARKAKEAFITSSTGRVLPVVQVDGKKIGDGKPGKITRRLMELYTEYVQKGRC